MASESFDVTLIFSDGEFEYKNRAAGNMYGTGEGLAAVLHNIPRPEQVLAEAVVSLGDRNELCDLPETRNALATFVSGAIAILEGYRKVDERVAQEARESRDRRRKIRIMEVS